MVGGSQFVGGDALRWRGGGAGEKGLRVYGWILSGCASLCSVEGRGGGAALEQPGRTRGPGSQCECRAFGFQHCMQYTQVRRVVR